MEENSEGEKERDEARTKGRKINVDNFRPIRRAFSPTLPPSILLVDRPKSDGDGDGGGLVGCDDRVRSCALAATSRSFSLSELVGNQHIRPKVGLP